MIFSRNEVNTSRQPSLDYAKGVAIICMIMCHATIMWSLGQHNVWHTVADEFLGGPIAAPMFMMCLGVGTCYSRHSSPLPMAKRGLTLLLVAYLLNFARGGLPLYLASLFVGHEAVKPYMAWGMLVGDILQFAGLAFLFLAIVKKLGMSLWQTFWMSIMLAIVGEMCAGYTTGNINIDAVLGIVIPAGAPDGLSCVSAFPFTKWIIFPVVGIIFGKALRHCENSDKLYGIVLAVTLPLSIVYTYCSLTYGFMPFSDGHYYWTTLYDAFFFIAFDLLIISLLHFVGKVIPEVVLSPLQKLSMNINTVYCISWVVIVWTSIPVLWFTNMKGVHPFVAYAVGLMVTVISYYLALVWKRFKERK